jgi:hypothetical protein
MLPDILVCVCLEDVADIGKDTGSYKKSSHLDILPSTYNLYPHHVCH